MLLMMKMTNLDVIILGIIGVYFSRDLLDNTADDDHDENVDCC